MEDGVRPDRVSMRTKLLVASYAASGLGGVLMVLWLAVVLLTYFAAGEEVARSLPVSFVFPWMPIAALIMFASKSAVRWSSRIDRQG